jgi:predicted HTH transcriptional regulator
MIMLHKITRLIAGGESETLDFKQTISDASKIAKTLVAFANNKGGTLLIGVRDNGSICGIRSEDEKYMLELAGTFYCEPKINVSYTEYEFDKKTVIEAKILAGNDKPYYAKDKDGKWWVYHRVHDQSLQASAVMFQVIKKQNRANTEMSSYSFLESEILKALTLEKPLSLNDIVNLVNIKKNRVIYSLAKLIHFNLVSVIHQQKQEYYSLKP